jgi:SNF2 family DNA or RNA helicase
MFDHELKHGDLVLRLAAFNAQFVRNRWNVLLVRRVIMTGTPVANRPYDIWAPIKFLDGGKSLGSSFSKFKEDLNLTNELADNVPAQQALEGELATIFSKIHSFTVRETKGSAGIELPEKHIENVSVHLEATQHALYERFRTELGAQVLRGGKLVTDDAEEILKRLLRLVQVASNPLLVDDSYGGEPGIRVLDLVSLVKDHRDLSGFLKQRKSALLRFQYFIVRQI